MKKITSISIFIILILNASGCAVSKAKTYSGVLCHCSNICWSVVGSTGIVDESAKEAIKLGKIRPELIASQTNEQNSDTRLHTYEDMSAHLIKDVSPGKYSIRYSIPTLSGVFHAQSQIAVGLSGIIKLTDRDKDKITIYLKEYDLLLPGDYAKIVATLSSTEKYHKTGQYEEISERNDNKGILLDINKLYFIEAVLETSRNITGPTSPQTNGEKIVGPSIAAILICPYLFD